MCFSLIILVLNAILVALELIKAKNDKTLIIISIVIFFLAIFKKINLLKLNVYCYL